jgi:hypothetical protein
MTGAVERAFDLAKTGHFESFTQVKNALRAEFNVARELVGRQLAADINRQCRQAKPSEGKTYGAP